MTYTPVKVDTLDAGWWDLDQLDDGLQMTKNNDRLDPKGAFTALVFIEGVDNIQNCTFIAKFKDVAGSRGWRLHQTGGTLYAGASTDGSSETSASVSNSDAVGVKTLLALTFDESNDIRVYQVTELNGEAVINASSGVALGGQIAGTPAKATIGLLQDDTVGINGKLYYAMTIDRQLTDSELATLFFQLGQPGNPLRPDFINPKPTMYWDAHQAVAATYDTEIPQAPDKNVYFDVVGTPVHGGISTPSRGHGKLMASHYDFDGSTEAMRLAGTDSTAEAFDPSLNGDDFTVVGVAETDTVSAASQSGILSKWNANGVDQRCWLLRRNEDDIEFLVSNAGTEGTPGTDYSIVERAASVSIGTPFFFCGRYQYQEDGTSKLSLDVDGTEVEDTSAVGPVYSNTGADILIADFDDTSDRFWDGKQYWLAYYNRVLTNEEKHDLRLGRVKPWDISGLVMYWDGHKAVAATYRTEFPDWAGFVFSVSGTPVQGGSAESSYLDDPEKSWWEFNGTNIALRLQGTDIRAPVFDPASNDNDFTIAGVIAPDSVSSVLSGIIGKWDENGVDKRCWAIMQQDNYITCSVSKDGTSGGSLTALSSPVGLSVGVKSFLCMRYLFIEDGASELKAYLDGTENTSSVSVGPVYSTTDADVQIADQDGTVDRFFDGEQHWFAYWNRKLTNREVDALEDGTVHPLALNPDWYWDGHQAVEDTYHSEAPYDTGLEFEVMGNPVKSGSSYPTIGEDNEKQVNLPELVPPGERPGKTGTGVFMVPLFNLEESSDSGVDRGVLVTVPEAPHFISPGNLERTTDRGADHNIVVQLPKRKGT